MLPGRERKLVTTALMLGSLLAALEATAVAAAVPTAVGSMGGVSRYSWVFSAYLLTSTTTVPLYGKLADLYGRRRIYLIAVALFVGGSALSGFSGSLSQLIVFRAIQGLGAGGLMPVAATVIGDIFTLEERGRMQGLFAAVWAFASLVGPLVGGLLTDALSWRAIFFLGVPFGLLSAIMLNRHLREEPPRREHRLDLLGTVLLSVAVTLLLLGLIEGPEVWGWGDPRTLATLAGALVLTLAFLWQEQRAPEPMLPLDLFKSRVIAVSCAGNALLGALLFALTAFGPILGQGVLGGSATDAGALLSPVLIGWPIASTITGRLMNRYSYRRFCITGGLLLAGSGIALARLTAGTTRLEVMATLFVMGLGLGFVSMPYMIAVQSAVPWRLRGVATGSAQFFRSIGGAVGVAALGALFAARLTQAVGKGVDANALLDPGKRAAMGALEVAHLSDAFLLALQAVFWGIGAIAVASLGVALWFPGGKPRDLAWVDPDPAAPPIPDPRSDAIPGDTALIAKNLVRLVLLGATLLATAPCVAASGPPSQGAPAEAPSPKPPQMKLHFAGLLAGRSYTVTLSDGAAFVGETSPASHVEKTADRLTFTVPEVPKGSDAPEIEEAMIETDVEISARTVTYQVELSGRTSVEIDLLGETQVRGRPLQLNGVPFKFELPIPELPKGWVLRAPPCPADPTTGKARTAAVHGGWSACGPVGPK